jgi:hypothetical protein
MLSSIFQDHIATLLTVVFLGGATADRLSLAPQVDPEPYHQSVRAAAQKLPDVIGDWRAADSPDLSTQAYLRANVFVSRTLTNSRSGLQVYLLIIQCRDARDLIPHYPAVCYPGRGMNQTEVRPRDWDISGMVVTGSEYRFESDGFRQGSSVIVDNFMILPTGMFCRDMKEVKSSLPIRDRFFGIGQVQIVFGEGTSAEMRDKAVREILGGHKDLIETIRSGLRG